MDIAYPPQLNPAKLLAALQRLALSKMLHPRLTGEEPHLCALHVDADVCALLGGNFVNCLEEDQFEAARDDPEAEALALFELEKQAEYRRAVATSILARERAGAPSVVAGSAEWRGLGCCRMWADTCNDTATELLQLVRTALPTYLEPLEVLPLGSLQIGNTKADSNTLYWKFPADNVRGEIVDQSDVDLFVREAIFRAGLNRSAAVPFHSFSLDGTTPPRDDDALVRWVTTALTNSGFAVCHDFLGAELARSLCEAELGGETESIQYGGGREGAGRGDRATLPDVLPSDLLDRLDSVVGQLRSACRCESAREGHDVQGMGQHPDSSFELCCAERLELCEFRSWPMHSVYRGCGSRFTWHLDNPNHDNGRVLTCVYYLNPHWTKQDGGLLRLMRQPRSNQVATVGDRARVPPVEILAEVVPTLDTLVLFWSDLIPHEVLPPTTGGLRRAISVWYLCPRLGAEQFVLGSTLPMSGQTVAEAARQILSHLVVDSGANESGRSDSHSSDETATAHSSHCHTLLYAADVSAVAHAWLVAQAS